MESFEDKLKEAGDKFDKVALMTLLLDNPQLPECLEAALESVVNESDKLTIAKLLMEYLEDGTLVSSKESKEWAQSVIDKKDQEECNELLAKYYVAFNKIAITLSSREVEIAAYEHTAMWLCSKGYQEIIKMVLSQGISLSTRGRRATALYFTFHRDVNGIQFLLDCDEEESELMASTIINHATTYRRIEIAKLILDRGLVNGDTVNAHLAMQLAIALGSTDIVQMLIDHGVNVKIECSIAYTYLPNNDVYRSHLFLATRSISWCCKEVVEMLLLNGAYIDPKEDDLLFSYAPNELYVMNNLTMFVKHYVLELAEGRSVRETHLENIKSDKQLNLFKMMYENELKKIKEHKFEGTNVSLYYLWKCSLNQMTGFLMNKAIGSSLTPGQLELQFPIYSNRIVKRLKLGFERKYRLGRVNKFFESLSSRKENRLPKLPATCVRQIFNLLTTEDLIVLRNAYY